MKKKMVKTIQFIANPHLLFCVLLAWIITNGWSYVFFAVGTCFGIDWMTGIAGAYLTFLWLPVSPEKLATFAIAIALLRVLFPHDQKTLVVLRGLHEKSKCAIREKKKRKTAQRKDELEEHET